MNGSPSQKEMIEPSYIDKGRPTYVDESAEDAQTPTYPARGQDAPAYIANNRYREYR